MKLQIFLKHDSNKGISGIKMTSHIKAKLYSIALVLANLIGNFFFFINATLPITINGKLAFYIVANEESEFSFSQRNFIFFFFKKVISFLNSDYALKCW